MFPIQLTDARILIIGAVAACSIVTATASVVIVDVVAVAVSVSPDIAAAVHVFSVIGLI